MTGLVLPADFDQRAGSGQALRLPAYYPHWADPDRVYQRAAFFEQQLSQASWAAVQLDLDGHAVYPLADSGGQPWLLSLNLVVVILVIGIALVPLLMIEEKEAQTLKVLLVSPANLNQVIAGKALVGLFYSLLPALVALLLYRYLFVHWGLAVLAILLAAGLGVAIGLLVGLLSDTPTTASMWGSLLLLLLIGSAFLKLFTGLNLPAAVQAALDWLPGAAMLQLINLSQAGEVPTRLLWLNVSALLAAIAVVTLLLAWRMRKVEG
jgi:ABC-type multidrug transport system permease subunit